MWMYVFFDLPVQCAEERKEASLFRKSLLDLGFSMAQFSVYYKLLSGKEKIPRYLNAIKSELPKSGKVDIMCITDKQYENIISFYSQKKVKKDAKPEQLLLF